MIRLATGLLAVLLGTQLRAAPAERDVVLFLGDSLTAGYGVAGEEAYPALLEQAWRGRGVPLKARNAGVSGATTAGVLESLDWSLTPDIRVLFLAVGSNDGLRGLSLKQSERNLEAIIRAAKQRGVKVALAGMRIPPNYGPEYARAFEALYPSLAKRHGLKFLPFLLKGVGGVPAMNVEDGVHPNAAGHRLMAARVGEFLEDAGLLK